MTISNRQAATWRDLFTVDLRSLAALRIALAALVLVDLLLRWPLLAAHYTDLGILTRFESAHHWLAPAPSFSFHQANGSPVFITALFVISTIFTLLLLLGLATRAATVATWVMLLSLQHRNYYVLDGGDVLLRLLLFWCIFLPCGACWSLDARRRPAENVGPTVHSPATVALMLQFVMVYVVAGVAKTGPQWWSEGTAIGLAVGQSYWNLPLGAWLAQYPTASRVLSPLVVLFEVVGPLLLFVPIATARVRMALLILFWLFQFGLGSTLALNIFPWANTAATLAFLPTMFWDRLTGKHPPHNREQTSSSPATLRRKPRLANDFVIASLAYAIVANINFLVPKLLPAEAKETWNRSVARLWQPVEHIGNTAGMVQRWNLYAPSPEHHDFVLEVLGRQRDGTIVRLMGPHPDDGWPLTNRFAQPGGSSVTVVDVTDDDWHAVRRLVDRYRFRYYLQKVLRPHRREPRTQAYLHWLARQWKTDRPTSEHLQHLWFFVISRSMLGDVDEPPQRLLVSEYEVVPHRN